MEAPLAAVQRGQAGHLPKVNGQQEMIPRKKASVSLHNDADLESNIKDQLAAVSRLTILSKFGANVIGSTSGRSIPAATSAKMLLYLSFLTLNLSL